MLRRSVPSTVFVLVVAQALLTGASWPAASATPSAVRDTGPSVPLVDPPGARCCQGIAFDGTNLVMFGGASSMVPLGDTWVWDGTTWTQVTFAPGFAPCPRRSTRAVWDGFHVMLYGGNGGAGGGGCPGGNYSDTWVWDGVAQTWTRVCDPCGPGYLFSPGMAYDPTPSRNYVVMFGGNGAGFVGGPTVFDENGSVISPLRETWVWQGSANPPFGSWTHMQRKNPHPCARSSPTLAWDATRGKVMLFGGTGGGNPEGGCLPNAYNDTWTWEGTKWMQCTTNCGTTPPDKRFGHRMEWDPETVLGHMGGQVVMFGGNTQLSGLDNDTWAIDGGPWTECLGPSYCTAALPIVRCCGGLAYFPNGASHGLIMYGGQDMGGIGGAKRELSGTWRFDGSNWICINPPCDP